MAQRLPLIPSTPLYRFGTVLEGTPYVFDVRWNERGEFWAMDILQEDETPIRTGIRIVLGTLLGGRSKSENMLPGVLVATDLSGAEVDAGFDDLGVRVVVWYYNAGGA